MSEASLQLDETPAGVPAPPFAYSPVDEPHRARTRAMLEAHPEIRELIGRNPWTALVISGVVAAQFAVAATVSAFSWWAVLLAAWCFGAFANHALFVTIHECSHGLVFRRRLWNNVAGIVADLPNVIPSSISFRRYHLKHHAFQGVFELDADIPNRWEVSWVGRSPVRKAVWLALYPVVQILRPARLKEIRPADPWLWLNVAVVVAVDLLVLRLLGSAALLYLGASLFFAVGLHPLGARWIQEHYVFSPPQETYSYYGPLNLVALNVGYHNEHHDFPSIPWNRLPELRRLASEFYDDLEHHRSWSGLLVRFLLDPGVGLDSRVVRQRHRSPHSGTVAG